VHFRSIRNSSVRQPMVDQRDLFADRPLCWICQSKRLVSISSYETLSLRSFAVRNGQYLNRNRVRPARDVCEFSELIISYSLTLSTQADMFYYCKYYGIEGRHHRVNTVNSVCQYCMVSDALVHPISIQYLTTTR